MTSRHDYQQQASDFLRLWQEQMTRQMSDPETIRAMLAGLQNFGAPPHDANARRDAHAPDAGDDAVRHLAKRLRAVEQQLAKLHARMDAAEKPARAGKQPGAKPVAKRKPAAKRRKPAMVAKPKPNAAKPKRTAKAGARATPARARTKAKRK